MKLAEQLVRWLLVGLWMLVIYYFSSQPELVSGLESMWDFVARKTAHVMEFFILCYLLTKALRSHELPLGVSLGVAVGVSLLYAGFDEWHQTTVAGREGRIRDVLIDTVGIAGYALLGSRSRT